MHIAARLGFAHPGRLLGPDGLTWDEVLDWLGAWEADPWGEQRADLRSGVLASYILLPWKERQSEPPPEALYPYFATAAEFDAAAAFAIRDAHLARFGLVA